MLFRSLQHVFRVLVDVIAAPWKETMQVRHPGPQNLDTYGYSHGTTDSTTTVASSSDTSRRHLSIITDETLVDDDDPDDLVSYFTPLIAEEDLAGFGDDKVNSADSITSEVTSKDQPKISKEVKEPSNGAENHSTHSHPDALLAVSEERALPAQYDLPQEVCNARRRRIFPKPLTIPTPQTLLEPFSMRGLYPTHPERLFEHNELGMADMREIMKIQPLTMSFKSTWEDGNSWLPFTHPTGFLYFCHQNQRVITRSYLYDTKIEGSLQLFLRGITRFLMSVGVESLTEDHHLVLDLVPLDKEEFTCGYYFVNHKNRSIYWLQDYFGHNFDVWKDIRVFTSRVHLGTEIEAQYWHHCYLFPSTTKLGYSLVKELEDIVLFYLSDTIRKPCSTSPFDHEELVKILGWLPSFKRTTTSAGVSEKHLLPGAASVFSHLMFMMTRERFLHFHGQLTVRLNREKSIYEPKQKKPFLLFLISPLMLSSPMQYYTTMEKLQVDGTVHIPGWRDMGARLMEHWKEIILYATAAFTISVAFLSIQSVDSASPPLRHPAQIACYISIVFIFGSGIVSSFLLKTEPIRYLTTKQASEISLLTLSIVYSVPFAFLVWGMIGFATAFFCICFLDTTLFTSIPVGCALFMTGLIVAWSSSVASKMTDKSHLHNTKPASHVAPSKPRSYREGIRTIWRYWLKIRRGNFENRDEEKGM